MIKIVIIGNSAAGFSCCQKIKESLSAEIVILSQENIPAYRKDLLFDYLAGDKKEDDLFLCSQDYYGKNGINFLKSSTAIRVDSRKKRVFLKDKTVIGYDYLVIASGQRFILPDNLGSQKDGVFVFSGLEEVRRLKERLMISEAACVAGDPSYCMRIAKILLSRGKEVKVISRMQASIEKDSDKIEYMDSLEVSELISEGSELKALKLNNGKVIGVPVFIFMGNKKPSLDFVKDSAIEMVGQYVRVNDKMFTNMQDILSCGAVCSFDGSPGKEKTWEDSVNEGVLCANSLISALERGKALCQNC